LERLVKSIGEDLPHGDHQQQIQDRQRERASECDAADEQRNAEHDREQ
jgi:hypothetical protein